MKTFLPHAARQLIRYRLDGALLALFISTALAAICQANQPSNGLPPRPFYVTGHNPNGVEVAIRPANNPSEDGWSVYWTTENQVKQCLDNGANALEPDISLRRMDIGVFEGDPLVLADLFCNDSDDLGHQMVPYVYTITSTNQQYACMQTGMDGIIAERDDMAAMKNLLTGRSDLRYAVPSDNLLIYQPNHPSAALGGVARTSGVSQVPAQFAEAYGVQFHTRAVANAGTDAVLTVRLIGPTGLFSETTVDTSADTNYGYNILGSRMENGEYDYVTIYSPDLGQPLSVRVFNNGANPNGVGGPDWEVSSIRVYSARYFGPSGYYKADGNRIFAGNSFTTVAMTGSGLTLMNVYSRINAPAGGNGTIGSPYQTFSSAYQFLAPFGTIHMGAGVYNEVTTTLDIPGKIVREPTYPGTGPVRLGHP